MIEGEEGELEEQEQEGGEEGQGELPVVGDDDDDEDLFRKFIEDEFSDDSDVQ